MTTYTMTGPDGKDYSIDGPAGQTPAQVAAVMHAHFSGASSAPETTLGGLAKSIVTRTAQAVTGAAGMGMDAVNALTGDPRDIYNAVAAARGKPTVNFPSNTQLLDKAVSAPTGGYYEPKTPTEENVGTIGSFLPAAFLGPEGIAARVASVAGPTIGTILGGAVTKGTPYQQEGKFVGGLFGGGFSGVRGRAPFATAKPPTVNALKTAASNAYQTVDNSGMVIAQPAVRTMVDSVKTDLAKQGFHPTLQPKTAAAFKVLDDAANNNQTLQGMDVLRRVTQNAVDPMNKSDTMMSRRIVDKIDDFVSGLGPNDVIGKVDQPALDALSNARDMWSRAAKGDQIQKLMDKAANNAPNFSASGYENALRTQFRKLANNDRAMARFSPDEQSAIKAVAQGTQIGNALRMLGKFAPHGIVSTAMSAGTGFAAGGPVGALALPAAGELARLGATAVTSRGARQASELMRRGAPAGPLPPMLTYRSPYPTFGLFGRP